MENNKEKDNQRKDIKSRFQEISEVKLKAVKI